MISVFTGRTKTAYDNSVNKEVSISLDSTSEFRVTDIQGLGPVKAEIATANMPLDPGGVYLSSDAGQRNIVLTLEYAPNWEENSTVASLRQQLMSVYMPKNKVEIEIMMDGALYTIDGVVETFEPVIFAKLPSVQISIICPRPYFRNAWSSSTYVLPVQEGNLFTVPYDGLVSTGFELSFRCNLGRTGMLFNGEPWDGMNYMAIEGFQFLVDDIVRISSVAGNRYVLLERNSNISNLLGWFGGSLIDTQLVNGLNYFTFNEAPWFTDVTLSYDTLYGGL